MVSFNPTHPVVYINLISVKTAAKYSGYSLQYIRRLLRAERLPAMKAGQLWLIDKFAFDAYLESAIKVKDGRFGPK